MQIQVTNQIKLKFKAELPFWKKATLLAEYKKRHPKNFF